MVFSELGTLFNYAKSGNLYVYGRNIYGQKNPVMVKKYAGAKRRRYSLSLRSNKRVRKGYNQRTAYGSKYKNGAPTTFQSQYATDYIKKKVSKGRKRLAKRRYRTFKKMLYKQLACQHILFRHQARVTAAENSQVWTDIPMYAGNGGTFPAAIPAAQRFQHMEQIGDDMVAGSGNQVTQEFGLVRSTYCQLDFQLTNRSNHTIQVNVYYYICKKNLSRFSASNDGINTTEYENTSIGLLDQVADLQFPSQAGATNLRPSSIGFTPFQSPRYCQYFTIVKKQRFQLAAGQAMTDMLKDKRIKEWTKNLVQDYPAMKGYTTGFLFNFHGMYDGSGEPSDYPQSVVDWSAQYTYNCKLLDRRVDTAVYNTTGL